MKFNSGLASVVVAALTETALSANVGRDVSAAGAAQPGQWACGLSQDNLDDLIDGYTTLLTAPNTPNVTTTAARILASNFTVYSDSMNSLANLPLGQPSFPPTRAGFLGAQSQIQPIPILLTTDVYVGGYWNSSYTPPSGSNAGEGGNSWWGGNAGAVCTDLRITWRWTAQGVGSGERPVSGIVDLVLSEGVEAEGQGKLVIETVYAEFNTVAWLLNVGVAGCVSPFSANGTTTSAVAGATPSA